MRKEIKFAFVQTIPVMLGYIFMGMAFGLLFENVGYNFIWSFFTSVFLYAGSGQFLLVDMLKKHTGAIAALVLMLSVQCRHMFYGLTFIEDFKKMGKAYPYMVFSLTDETYSLLWGTKIPDGLDFKRTRFLIALLDHLYWIVGCTAGALIGSLITFDVTGVDYAMTALFIVIMTEQWLSGNSHTPALIGTVTGILFIVLLGGDKFLLPSLAVSVGALLVARKREEITEKGDKDADGY